MEDYVLARVSAPACYPVTLAEAKKQCEIDDDITAHDVYLNALIAAATSWAEDYLGRALVQQTWDMHMECFPEDEIEIPKPPLQSVTSITYLDISGNRQTWDSTDYEVQSGIEDCYGEVKPVYGGTWPTTRGYSYNSVTVRFVCGYPVGSPTDDAGRRENVPQAIKQAILFLVAHWFRYREPVGAGLINKIPMTAEYVCAGHRMNLL